MFDKCLPQQSASTAPAAWRSCTACCGLVDRSGPSCPSAGSIHTQQRSHPGPTWSPAWCVWPSQSRPPPAVVQDFTNEIKCENARRHSACLKTETHSRRHETTKLCVSVCVVVSDLQGVCMSLEASGCCEAAGSTEPWLSFLQPAGGAVHNIFKLLQTGGDLIDR